MTTIRPTDPSQTQKLYSLPNKKKSIDEKLDDQDNDLNGIIKTLDDTMKLDQKVNIELDKSKEKIANARNTSKNITENMDVSGRNLNEIKKRSGLIGFLKSVFE